MARWFHHSLSHRDLCGLRSLDLGGCMMLGLILASMTGFGSPNDYEVTRIRRDGIRYECAERPAGPGFILICVPVKDLEVKAKPKRKSPTKERFV